MAKFAQNADIRNEIAAAIANDLNKAIPIIHAHKSFFDEELELRVFHIISASPLHVVRLFEDDIFNSSRAREKILNFFKQNHLGGAFIAHSAAYNKDVLQRLGAENLSAIICAHSFTPELCMCILSQVPESYLRPEAVDRIINIALNIEGYALTIKEKNLKIDNPKTVERLNERIRIRSAASYCLLNSRAVLSDDELLEFSLSAIQDSKFAIEQCRRLHPIAAEVYNLMRLGFSYNKSLEHVLAKNRKNAAK